MDIQKVSGIYKIENLDNGKIYIGSSINTKQRRNAHKSYLRKNKHANPHLQAAWNKYGETAFVFSIVEECNEKELIEREQYYMDKFDSVSRKWGYNIRPEAGRNTVTDEMKANMSLAAKKYFKENPEARDRLKKQATGLVPWNKGKAMSKKEIEKLSIRTKEKWEDPEYREHMLAKLKETQEKRSVSKRIKEKRNE